MFCWRCMRDLDKYTHATALVDGNTVRVHHSCLPLVQQDEAQRSITRQPRDEVPLLIQRYPERRYG